MQKHVIKRQVIELSVPDRVKAQQLQAEVSRIYRQRLVPLLDQLCTELSSPDRIHRIERLDIDLGHIDPDQLERELVKRAHQALHQALAQEIDQQERMGQPSEQQPQTRSQLELLAFFLRTGSLPWWADAGRPRLLNDTLQFLIETAPDALRRTLRDLTQSDVYLRRLVQAFDDERLAQLAIVLASKPDDMRADDLEAFITLLTQTRQIPENLLRQQFWLNILHLSGRAPGLTIRPTKLYQAILTQLAVQFGIAYATLLDELEQGLRTTTPLPETLKTSIQNLLALEAGPSPPLEGIEGGPLRQLLAELNKLERQAIPDSSLREVIARIAKLVHTTLEPQHLLSTEQQSLLAELAAWDADDITPDILTRLRTITQALEKEAVSEALVPDLSFSEADEVYIHNAGLVILWPFLTRFFENLELLAERRFKDEAAQHRAAGILQVLVRPEETFPEYLLPLNKILCGLELASVFTFGPALTETEIEHCAPFLEAVIAQAPILKNMSVAGFQGTFLLRQGMLSTRDGAWLLRVERETYDVVLDQFPWGWQWVKLPWMESALRVEW